MEKKKNEKMALNEREKERERDRQTDKVGGREVYIYIYIYTEGGGGMEGGRREGRRNGETKRRLHLRVQAKSYTTSARIVPSSVYLAYWFIGQS